MALSHDEYLSCMIDPIFSIHNDIFKNERLSDIYIIRTCRFDVDKSGGLKLILNNKKDHGFQEIGISLEEIQSKNIKCKAFMMGVSEFIPIMISKKSDIRCRYLGENKVFLNCQELVCDMNNALHNNILMKKDTYALWKEKIYKVKFSHFEVYSDEDDLKFDEYKTYDEMPEEYKRRGTMEYIYEIIKEN